MKPHIEKTSFGAITVDGTNYSHDILIRMDGEVEKRKKKLSKSIYGTSHIISLDEAKQIFQIGAKRLIVGSGQFGSVKLSMEAEEFFTKNGCHVELIPTPEAIQAWNQAGHSTIGVFHLTC